MVHNNKRNDGSPLSLTLFILLSNGWPLKTYTNKFLLIVQSSSSSHFNYVVFFILHYDFCKVLTQIQLLVEKKKLAKCEWKCKQAFFFLHLQHKSQQKT